MLEQRVVGVTQRPLSRTAPLGAARRAPGPRRPAEAARRARADGRSTRSQLRLSSRATARSWSRRDAARPAPAAASAASPRSSSSSSRKRLPALVERHGRPDLVVDLEGGRQPGLERVLGQDALGEAVQRGDGGARRSRRGPTARGAPGGPRRRRGAASVGGQLLERLADAIAQLAGRRLGEGDGGDVAQLGPRPVATSSTMRSTSAVVLPVPAPASTNSVSSRSRRMRSRAGWSSSASGGEVRSRATSSSARRPGRVALAQLDVGGQLGRAPSPAPTPAPGRSGRSGRSRSRCSWRRWSGSGCPRRRAGPGRRRTRCRRTMTSSTSPKRARAWRRRGRSRAPVEAGPLAERTSSCVRTSTVAVAGPGGQAVDRQLQLGAPHDRVVASSSAEVRGRRRSCSRATTTRPVVGSIDAVDDALERERAAVAQLDGHRGGVVRSRSGARPPRARTPARPVAGRRRRGSGGGRGGSPTRSSSHSRARPVRPCWTYSVEHLVGDLVEAAASRLGPALAGSDPLAARGRPTCSAMNRSRIVVDQAALVERG